MNAFADGGRKRSCSRVFGSPAKEAYVMFDARTIRCFDGSNEKEDVSICLQLTVVSSNDRIASSRVSLAIRLRRVDR